MKQKFDVSGMTCSACSAHVENAVKKVDGVTSVSVSLLTNSMIVQFDSDKTDVSKIEAAVKSAGYSANAVGHSPTEGNKENKSKKMLVRLLISIGFCVVLMYVSMGHMIGLPLPSFLCGKENAVSFALIQLLLCLPVWFVNKDYFTVGFKRLFCGSPNMDSLIAVGSLAGALYAVAITFIMSHALGHGDLATVELYNHQLYFESSAMILALVDLGKYFETCSKQKTGVALSKLKKLTPQTAILLVDGNQVEVEVSQIGKGDTVVVKAGAAFPCDGVVYGGNCFVDESAISGESLPVEKQIGDKVIGGTVNIGGYVEVTVTSVGADSTLAKIIDLVEEAGSSKAPIQRLADKIAAVFTPVVMCISLATLVVWLCVGQPLYVALDFAISVLVISCPCALGLATPVAIMVATGKGAENGILVKDGEVLERLSHIKQVVLDKTGTITMGTPKVVDFRSSINSEEFFAVIGGIEKQSEHPLGNAIVNYAEELGVQLIRPQSFCTLPGMGVTAEYGGSNYAIGNVRLMERCDVPKEQCDHYEDEFRGKPYTCLLVAKNDELIGVVCVGDEIRQTSVVAIARLKKLGIKTVMLTGDGKASANAVANVVGIDEVYAEVLPDQKQQKIAELMNDGFTAMVGDGINDAPALMQADIGFAIGSGSDIAVDSADVVLVKNDLCDVATAIELSAKTIRNIKQNLFWAFFYNGLGIPVAAGVLFPILQLKLSPMLAAAAMSLSSLFVVTNALRLKLFKPKNVFAPTSCTLDKICESVVDNQAKKDDNEKCDDCMGR